MRQLSLQFPATACSGRSPAMHCRYCGSEQPMSAIAHYPLLYCGKDAVLYRCVVCGSERTASTPLPRPSMSKGNERP